MFTFLLFLILSPVVLFFTSLIPFQVVKLFRRPKLDRNWDPLHKELAQISVDKNNPNIVYIKNIRNAKYNPNYEYENKVEYQNKKFNLDNLTKLWILVDNYDYLQNHVIVSFQFSDNFLHNTFLTFSYEIRKTNIEDFSIYKTPYFSYEGFYLVATEEDAFYVRSNVRKSNNLYLYPLDIDKVEFPVIFSKFINVVNMQNTKPEFYKIFTSNCLSRIFSILQQSGTVKIRWYNYLNINNFLYKSNLVINRKSFSYKEFLDKFKIKNITNLEANDLYSFNLRKNNLK